MRGRNENSVSAVFFFSARHLAPAFVTSKPIDLMFPLGGSPCSQRGSPSGLPSHDSFLLNGRLAITSSARRSGCRSFVNELAGCSPKFKSIPQMGMFIAASRPSLLEIARCLLPRALKHCWYASSQRRGRKSSRVSECPMVAS